MDHRLNVRVPLELPVQLQIAEGTLSGTTVDLSFEGVRVRLHDDPPLPSGRVQVCFEPDAVGISVPAFAVRQDDVDLGLMFLRYHGEAETYLTNRISEALDRAKSKGGWCA